MFDITKKQIIDAKKLGITNKQIKMCESKFTLFSLMENAKRRKKM